MASSTELGDRPGAETGASTETLCPTPSVIPAEERALTDPLSLLPPPRSPDFNPIGHSWIIVPEPDALTGTGTTDSTTPVRSCWSPHTSSGLLLPPSLPMQNNNSSAEPEPEGRPTCSSAVLQTSPPTDPSSLPPSPLHATLSHSLMAEGEDVAALAVSELLGSNWPLLTTTLPSPLCLSPPIPRRCESGGTDPAARGFEGGADDAHATRQPEGTPLLSAAGSAWGYLTSQPMALVAVLIASHAAAFLLGLAIGRSERGGGIGSAATAASDYMLQRRFSSGPFGVHARLCMS